MNKSLKTLWNRIIPSPFASLGAALRRVIPSAARNLLYLCNNEQSRSFAEFTLSKTEGLRMTSLKFFRNLLNSVHRLPHAIQPVEQTVARAAL